MARMNSTNSSGQHGFTLVELIAVIVIIGIVGAMALPRFTASRPFSERAYYEELAAALRYSRAAAVSTGCPVRFVLNAGSYGASQQSSLNGRCDPADSSWSQSLAVSDGSPVSGSAPISVTATPPATIVFNPLGATGLGSNQAINVGNFSLTIHAVSGYVDAP